MKTYCTSICPTSCEIACFLTHAQINVVFDRLLETRNFDGYVVFLEEDHFVSPDFIVMAKKLGKLMDE